MTGRSHKEHLGIVTPPRLSQPEIDELLQMRLIAKLASKDAEDSIHVVPIWFRRDGNYILMPTSRFTRKYRNLVARPEASLMIDLSRSGLDIRGVLLRGSVEIVEGDEARHFNRSIHLRYVSEEGLALEDVNAYLVEGDDVTLRLSIDKVVSWNNANSPAGRALSASGAFPPLQT